MEAQTVRKHRDLKITESGERSEKRGRVSCVERARVSMDCSIQQRFLAAFLAKQHFLLYHCVSTKLNGFIWVEIGIGVSEIYGATFGFRIGSLQ